MADVTRHQDEWAQRLAALYGRSRVMRLANGAVIVFGMTENLTVVRMTVQPDGTCSPASRAELDEAWRLALAHVRVPCDRCNYPAKSPRCARCGAPVGYVAGHDAEAA